MQQSQNNKQQFGTQPLYATASTSTTAAWSPTPPVDYSFNYNMYIGNEQQLSRILSNHHDNIDQLALDESAAGLYTADESLLPQSSFSLVLRSYRDLDFILGIGSTTPGGGGDLLSSRSTSSYKCATAYASPQHNNTENYSDNTSTTILSEDVIYENRDDENTRLHQLAPSSLFSSRSIVDANAFIDVVMSQALKHWCCIGFKVAPVSLEYIHDWNNAALPIRYCVAAITLVSLKQQDQDNKHASTTSFAKDGALSLYNIARNQVENVLFEEDSNPTLIQSTQTVSSTPCLEYFGCHQSPTTCT